MNKQSALQIATLVAPISAALIGGALYLLQNTRLIALSADLRATRDQVDASKSLLNQMEGESRMVRYPTAAQNEQEQPAFLDALRDYAVLNHVRIERWTNAPTMLNPNSPEKLKRGLPSEVTPLTCNLAVSGTYADVRGFFYSVLRSSRLINMNDMHWTREIPAPRTIATFSLTRYVAPPGKASTDINSALAYTVAQSPAPQQAPTTAPAVAVTNPDPSAAGILKPGIINAPDPRSTDGAQRLMSSNPGH